MTFDEIAEQLVTEWQRQGKTLPIAWDFRGFAAAAAEMGAKAEREECANICEELGMHGEPENQEYGSWGEFRDAANAIRSRSNAGAKGTPTTHAITGEHDEYRQHQNEADGA